jgi:hypothetical protein
MKKIVLVLLVLGGVSISANAQSSGDLFVGGSSNLGITITPDFNLNGNVTADYFIMDGLSVGGNLGLGIGSATSFSLAPSVKYFVKGGIFAMVSADVLSIAGGTTTVGLNSLNAGVGYWYALGGGDVVVAPMLNLSNLTNDLGIGLGMGISVKL